MSELGLAIERYLSELGRVNASAHTIRNYASDLDQFREYFSPPGAQPPTPAAIDARLLREWLTSLYDRKLDSISVRRKLAAVRSFFQFLPDTNQHHRSVRRSSSYRRLISADWSAADPRSTGYMFKPRLSERDQLGIIRQNIDRLIGHDQYVPHRYRNRQ